jgi:hypothetical protein
MLTLNPDVLTASRKPHLRCPKCHHEGELLAVWLVGTVDRLLGAEVRCAKCLATLARTAIAGAPEPVDQSTAAPVPSSLYVALAAAVAGATVAELDVVQDDMSDALEAGSLSQLEAARLEWLCSERRRELTGGG